MSDLPPKTPGLIPMLPPQEPKPGIVERRRGGREKDPLSKIQLRKLTNEQLADTINLAVQGNIKALKDIIEDPNSSALRVGIATSLIKAVRKGDWDTIEKILERVVGKAPITVNHRVSEEDVPIRIYLPEMDK
jgi:hypothetical protein